jgi:hypothetical protein
MQPVFGLASGGSHNSESDNPHFKFKGVNGIMTKATTMVLVALAANLAWCGGTRAGQTWICSVTSAVAVDEDGTVGPPDTGSRERPTFFRIDTSTKELTLLAPKSRRGEVTKLDTAHESEGQWLLSGVEHGRGLSVIVTAEGRMSLSVVGDGVVWSVFGNALPEGESLELVKSESTPAPEDESADEPESDSEDESTEASEVSKSESAEPSEGESN